MAEAAELPLIMPSRRHGLTKVVETAFADRGLKARIAVEVDDLPLLLGLVAAGRGASVLPARALRHATGQGGPALGVAPLDPAPVRTLALAMPLDRLPTPAAARVRDLVAAALRDDVHPSVVGLGQPAVPRIAGHLAALPSKGTQQWRM